MDSIEDIIPIIKPLLELSIPLNGFLPLIQLRDNLERTLLSIPLNGFSTIIELGRWWHVAFNSIEWILHHHGLCTLWKPAHLHYLDSLPLTPRLGVSCILWSPKLICFSVSSPWFFSCVYMGISIVTVSPLVYG